MDPSIVGFTRRTLDTLAKDHKKFLAAGGNVKQVKEYHNVLQEPFFEIPIDQVQNHNFTIVCMSLNVV